MIRIKHSSFGSKLDMTVFTITATKMTAQKSNVPCQRWKLYSGLFRAMRPWMSVPQR